MTKEHILRLIREVAASNGGNPPGRQVFKKETGITESNWVGKYWARWGDALAEAGLSPNELNTAITDDDLLESLALLVREMGRIPVASEMKLKRRADPTFPSYNTFSRFSTKSARIAALLKHATKRGYDDVIQICVTAQGTSPPPRATRGEGDTSTTTGFVYLLKHGSRSEYKIGKTYDVLRRTGEIRVELPHPVKPIHVIETDDPAGVESYWHRRFADRRLRGEWFALTAADVAAFRRWKNIA